MNRPLWLRVTLALLYTSSVLAMFFLLVKGWPYYRLSLQARPHHGMHDLYKSTGIIGLGLGVIGTLQLLLMMLYIPRKRLTWMQNLGDLRHWLDMHIWLGLTGSMLICFHTTFKVGGLVSIAFWSMIAVSLSGILGRYLYVQIPRGLDGHELSQNEIETELGEQLHNLSGGADLLQQFSESESSGLGGWLIQDLRRIFSSRDRLQWQLQKMGYQDPQNLARRLTAILQLRRRSRRLETVRRLLHHWHVIHRPFALVMFIFLGLHICIALLFGLSWR